MNGCILTFFAEETYSEGGREISDLAKRNTLLSAHSKQCKQLAEMYRNLAKQINDKITICRDVTRCVICNKVLMLFIESYCTLCNFDERSGFWKGSGNKWH